MNINLSPYSARERRASYTPVRPPLDPAGRIVIVVDDGLATAGSTMIAALHSLREPSTSKVLATFTQKNAQSIARIDFLNFRRSICFC